MECGLQLAGGPKCRHHRPNFGCLRDGTACRIASAETEAREHQLDGGFNA